jgi:hypothetical protein
MKVEILTDFLYIYYPCVKKSNRKEMLQPLNYFLLYWSLKDN